MEENTAAAVKQPTYYESLVEKLGGAAKCAAGVTVLEDHGSWVLLKKGGSKYCFNLDDTKAKLEDNQAVYVRGSEIISREKSIVLDRPSPIHTDAS